MLVSKNTSSSCSNEHNGAQGEHIRRMQAENAANLSNKLHVLVASSIGQFPIYPPKIPGDLRRDLLFRLG